MADFSCFNPNASYEVRCDGVRFAEIHQSVFLKAKFETSPHRQDM